MSRKGKGKAKPRNAVKAARKRKPRPLPLTDYLKRYGSPKKGHPRRAEYEASDTFKLRSGRAKRAALMRQTIANLPRTKRSPAWEIEERRATWDQLRRKAKDLRVTWHELVGRAIERAEHRRPAHRMPAWFLGLY